MFFKLNSLTDREVIDKIAEASCAGVRVDMIIRGISCLKPNIAGKTENVHVRSIVGRFLEHARVYAFGVDSDMIYLSSADMMTRNTEHRVEIAFPVLDPTCRALVHEYMGVQLRDNVKARSLTSDGTWVPVERKEGEKPFNSQEFLLERAYRNAESAAVASEPVAKANRNPHLFWAPSPSHSRQPLRYRRSRRPSSSPTWSPSPSMRPSLSRRPPSPRPRQAPAARNPPARPKPSSAIAPVVCAWAWA